MRGVKLPRLHRAQQLKTIYPALLDYAEWCKNGFQLLPRGLCLFGIGIGIVAGFRLALDNALE